MKWIKPSGTCSIYVGVVQAGVTIKFAGVLELDMSSEKVFDFTLSLEFVKKWLVSYGGSLSIEKFRKILKFMEEDFGDLALFRFIQEDSYLVISKSFEVKFGLKKHCFRLINLDLTICAKMFNN